MDREYERVLIPQPLIPTDAGEDAFPERLERKCCPYKSCRNTDLYRAFEYDRHTGARVFGYRRGSNDDWYYGPHGNLAALAEEMNNPERWPVDEDALDALFERHRNGIYEDEEDQ